VDTPISQKTTAQKEEEDQIPEILKHYDSQAPPSRSEIDRLKKNKANVDYYRTNKEKILDSKKKHKRSLLITKCGAAGIPGYLSDYIQFRSTGEIYLAFKDTEELKKVLHWIKFKSLFAEDIILETNKPPKI
jgi:hypothetical protein